jgi:NAD(P)H dehydrogenase (quinone)
VTRTAVSASIPTIFIVGATGQTGKLILQELDSAPEEVHVRLGVRSQADIDRLRTEGRDAVHFDLDDPRTFGAALAGVDRLYLLTGYTVAMTHQSKTLVDAAKKAGVGHIVNQGVFADWDCTDPHFVWFSLVERYIEASGIAWTHLHPNVFMEYLLASSPPKGGTFSVFWGPDRVGWVALRDVAAVAVKVLREGPEKHASRDYWMSTVALGGEQVASILTDVLGRSIQCDVRDPSEFEALFKSGSLNVEHWYAKGAVDFCVQVADGRMGYIGTVRDEIPHLLGRSATTFSQWAAENRAQLLHLVDTAA